MCLVEFPQLKRDLCEAILVASEASDDVDEPVALLILRQVVDTVCVKQA